MRCVLLSADRSASLSPANSLLSPFMIKALSFRTSESILRRCAGVRHQHDSDFGNLPCFHLILRLNFLDFASFFSSLKYFKIN